MSGAYYTEENIDRQAGAYLDEVSSFSESRDLKIKVEECALLVIDMQYYFLDKKSHAFIPSAGPTIPRIKKLQDIFVRNNRPVIQTRHIDSEQDAGMMRKWWSDFIAEESPLSEIIIELRNKQATIVLKSQYDAFHKTDLEPILKSQNVHQVLISGVATHLCCETTARSAFVRGFETFFAIDCVSTFSEEFHRATILNLSHGFATPVLSSEIPANQGVAG